jgi:transposase-like protein
MDSTTASYRGHRFPPEIISHGVWLYHRFCLSFRDVEDLLAEPGITVSCETIRPWCRKFGTRYARRLKGGKGGWATRGTWTSSANHRMLRDRSFRVWRQVTCAC